MMFVTINMDERRQGKRLGKKRRLAEKNQGKT
jgi:hypothetical protein